MEIFKASPKSEASGHNTIHIAILVDTQAVIAKHNISAANVVYMMDDNGSGPSPSTGEGSYELNTHCSPGDQISWKVFAINGNDSITFKWFRSSTGNVFGNNPPSGANTEYLATVVTEGSDTYQVGVEIAGDTSYTYSWDPYITSKA